VCQKSVRRRLLVVLRLGGVSEGMVIDGVEELHKFRKKIVLFCNFCSI
jgi:hypothetical protein